MAGPAKPDQSIQSEIIKTENGEQTLVQSVLVDASVSDVWAAYTTSEGWMNWAAPLAEVNLKAGGTIKTHYGQNAKIGDAGTNILHIVNYVPERVLTLRAELSERWPAVMKQDHGKLMNIIVFHSLSEKTYPGRFLWCRLSGFSRNTMSC